MRNQIKELEISNASPKDYPPSIIKLAGVNIVSANRMGAAKELYRKIRPRYAFEKIDMEIAKDFTMINNDILKILASRSLKRIRDTQLYYYEANNLSEWKGFFLATITGREDQVFIDSFKHMISTITEDLEKFRFVIFLRGSSLSNSDTVMPIPNNGEVINLKPGKRKISQSGNRIKNVIAPEDYRDLSIQLNYSQEKIFFLGFYLLDIPLCVEYSNLSLSGDANNLKYLDSKNKLHFVPTYSLPISSSFHERWGQDSAVDGPINYFEEDIESDD